MKYLISADIEGTAGALNWSYTLKGNEEYRIQREIMRDEVRAVVDGINKMDENAEIIIKDAHDTADNLDIRDFPGNCKIIRGWSGEPTNMVQGIEKGMAGVFFVGYHARLGSGGSQLAHSFNARKFKAIRLNGRDVSEFYFHYLIAAYYGVPTLLLSGDSSICEEVKELDSEIKTVETFEGLGGSIISKTPVRVREEIYEASTKALGKNPPELASLSGPWVLEVEYNRNVEAKRASYYPGCEEIDNLSIRMECEDIYDIFVALNFI